jgi:hypothetical protein
MVLGGRPPGRVGRRRDFSLTRSPLSSGSRGLCRLWESSLIATAPRTRRRRNSIREADTYNRPNARAVATAKPSRLLGAPQPSNQRGARRNKPGESLYTGRRSEPFGPPWEFGHERSRRKANGRRSEAIERIERIEFEQLRRPHRRKSEWVELGETFGLFFARGPAVRHQRPEPVTAPVGTRVDNEADRWKSPTAPRRRGTSRSSAPRGTGDGNETVDPPRRST